MSFIGDADMIWVDYAILGLISISLVIGLFRGFVEEAFSLVLWVVAIWLGLTFSREFSTLLEPFFSVPSARIAAAFAALFFAVLIGGALVNLILRKLVKQTGLTGSDRFAGMIFGIARGLVVVTVCIMLAGLTPLPEDAWWKESTLIPPFQSLAVWLREHIRSDVMSYVNYR
ncbi:MAG: colicin V production CvpA [Gammaproteobacteria bacterium HGW-Gammaproteobacteria-10]|nr:MAG: colicin V production CvpA [Gammaproteobacteria bacterium HGW-Gammaproteobacteria-10]